MPKVGNKRFPYTRQGLEEAKEYAAKTGSKVKLAPPKAARKGSRSRDR